MWIVRMALRRDGKTVMLSSGLDEQEHIVLNPGTGILDGERVQPVMFNKAQ